MWSYFRAKTFTYKHMHKRQTLREKKVVHDNYKVFFYKISEAF